MPWFAAWALLAQGGTLGIGQRAIVEMPPGEDGFTWNLVVEEPREISFGGWSHHTDLVLTLESTDGAVLASDDDSGIATNPWLCWTPPAPDEFVVRLRGDNRRPAFVGIRLLLGCQDPTPPDPAAAERAYWEGAMLRCRLAGDESRVEAAARRLVDLGAAESADGALRRFSDQWQAIGRIQATLARSDTAAGEGRADEARGILVAAFEEFVRVEESTSYIATLTYGEIAQRANALGDPLEKTAVARIVLGLGAIRPDHDSELLQMQQNLAVALSNTGEILRARALDESVLAVCRRVLPPDDPQTLGVMNNLSVKLKAFGDLSRSLHLQEEVLARRERVCARDDPELVRSRYNLALTLDELGDSSRADALYRQVVDSWASAPDFADWVLLDLRSDLARREGKLEEALELTREAMRSALERLPATHQSLLELQSSEAMLLANLGRKDEAEQLLVRILEERERILPEGDPFRLNTLGNLAWKASNRGDVAARDDYLRRLCREGTVGLAIGRSLSWQEGLVAANNQQWELMTAVSLVPAAVDSSPDLAPALVEWIETRRSLAVRDGFLAGRDDDAETRRLRDSVMRSRSRCAELAERTLGGVEIDLDELRRAVDAREDAEHRWAEHTRTAAPRRFDVASIAHGLSTRTAAVGWVRQVVATVESIAGQHESEERLLAHVVRPDGRLVRLDLAPTREVEAAVTAWRRAIGAPLDGGRGSIAPGEQRRAAGEQLRALVLDPVLAAAGPIAELVACPDDVLHGVPLDCLPIEDGCVGDRLTVRRVLSFDPLLRSGRPVERGPARLLAMGGIEYAAGASGAPPGRGAGFPPLPESAQEVDDVSGLFSDVFSRPAVRLTGPDASVEAFRREASGVSYLHVATHAWFDDPGDDAPMLLGVLPLTLSGLAFAGASSVTNALGEPRGILLGEELAALDLSGCELAVLSACNSHAGVHWAGRGIASLHSALSAAGVRATVTAFWPVSDEFARAFMRAFYEALWREELTPSEAIWKARKVLRSQRVPEREWAAFVLTGATL